MSSTHLIRKIRTDVKSLKDELGHSKFPLKDFDNAVVVLNRLSAVIDGCNDFLRKSK
jgi:hypothetical protein